MSYWVNDQFVISVLVPTRTTESVHYTHHVVHKKTTSVHSSLNVAIKISESVHYTTNYYPVAGFLAFKISAVAGSVYDKLEEFGITEGS